MISDSGYLAVEVSIVLRSLVHTPAEIPRPHCRITIANGCWVYPNDLDIVPLNQFPQMKVRIYNHVRLHQSLGYLSGLSASSHKASLTLFANLPPPKEVMFHYSTGRVQKVDYIHE